LEINDNILNFPAGKSKRFQSAIEAYKRGDFREALELATSLIDKGDAHANTLAGAIYEKGGNGVEQDFEKAKFYYQMAVDEVGAAESWLALGRLHYYGKGMPRDYEKAFYYYSVVDEDTENSIAYLMLGRMYMDGTGVEKNLSKASEYFEKAIKKGAVFGYTYLGMLEKSRGHILRSIFLRGKAAYLAFRITLHDPNDSRLRRC
jgi:TPR repeat protein